MKMKKQNTNWRVFLWNRCINFFSPTQLSSFQIWEGSHLLFKKIEKWFIGAKKSVHFYYITYEIEVDYTLTYVFIITWHFKPQAVQRGVCLATPSTMFKAKQLTRSKSAVRTGDFLQSYGGGL